MSLLTYSKQTFARILVLILIWQGTSNSFWTHLAVFFILLATGSLTSMKRWIKNVKSKNFDVKLESIEGSRGMLSTAPFSIVDDFALVSDQEAKGC